MAQVIASNGTWGGAGLLGPVIYASGIGDPNNAVAVAPLTLNGLVVTRITDLTTCDVGSEYVRNDAPDSTHAIYVKTAMGVPGQTAGVWTNK